jgi:N-acetyl-anhydromuramyl-L-alanine amidase AmpD
MALGDLIIGGQLFKIDAPVVNWHDSGWDARTPRCVPVPGFSESYSCITAYGERAKWKGLRRYSTRPALRKQGETPRYADVRQLIRKFVVHHDGCADAKMCFNVLHNERGLSCHFLIDNDGKIYQTLDLGLMGFHASADNVDSVGVELASRGEVELDGPEYYSKKGRIKRQQTLCKVNGHTYKVWAYTDQQWRAFKELARALRSLLPNLPLEYPQDPAKPGHQAWKTLGNDHVPLNFAGYVGHYHLTNRKWDPGPFDFQKFCKEIRGVFCMPLFAKDDPKRDEKARPEIPVATDELRAISDELYEVNEARADGGFFPVGPWGEARLWHGGIHLTGKLDQPLFSAFPGRVVAARMGADSPTMGSNNFVLVRHDMTLGKESVRFHMLYMHVKDQLGVKDPKLLPAWMNEKGWKEGAAPNKVVLLDEPIEAGVLIARMGEAGPNTGDENLRKPQLHLEVFSKYELFRDFKKWEYVDGTGGGRFCEVDDEINSKIDTDGDGTLERSELSAFFTGAADAQLRYMATFHVSEWTVEPDWKTSLRTSSRDFAGMDPDDLDAMVDEQITPGLWWTPEVAVHAGLPVDGEVFHYHPVSFLHWFNEKLLESGVQLDDTKEEDVVSTKSTGVMGDIDDEAGEFALTKEEDEKDPCDEVLGVEQLAMGYEAPEC